MRASRLLAWLLPAAAAVVASVGLLAAAVGRPAAYLTRDPAAAVRDGDCSTECTYAGLLSNLGVLVLAAGVTTCVLAAMVLGPRERAPWSWGGVLLGVLLVDDLFGMHDHLAPTLVPHGELLVYGALATAGALYLVAFRGFLVQSGLAVLPLLAGALFGLSTAGDRLFPGHHLIEDGSKFLGICTLTAFFLVTCLAQLRRRTSA